MLSYWVYYNRYRVYEATNMLKKWSVFPACNNTVTLLLEVGDRLE